MKPYRIVPSFTFTKSAGTATIGKKYCRTDIDQANVPSSDRFWYAADQKQCPHWQKTREYYRASPGKAQERAGIMQTRDSDKTKEMKKTEPAMTLLEEGRFLCILLELPGIAEEKIRINLENQLNLVTIIASNTWVQYKKVIPIPCEVRFSKKRFSDGVLELTLEKTNPANLCAPW